VKEEGGCNFIPFKKIIALCFFKARLLHKLHTSFPSNKMVVEEEAYGVCKNNSLWCGQVAW